MHSTISEAASGQDYWTLVASSPEGYPCTNTSKHTQTDHLDSSKTLTYEIPVTSLREAIADETPTEIRASCKLTVCYFCNLALYSDHT